MDASFNVVTGQAELNQALFQVTHGLYVLTAVLDGRPNGQCLDAMMQVTNMPPRVAIGVGKRTLTHEMIFGSGFFAVNVIDRELPDCYDLVRRFGFQSGRKVDKFDGLSFSEGENGCPLLPNAKAFFECRVVADKTADLGTHSLFVGLVERAGTREAGSPLTYNEYRAAMKKGR